MPIVPSWATGGPVTPRAWSIPGPQPALWRLSSTQRAARQRGDPSSRAAPSRRIVRRSARQPAGRAVNRVLARTTGAATTARVGGWVLPERGVVQPMAIDQPLAPIDEAGGHDPVARQCERGPGPSASRAPRRRRCRRASPRARPRSVGAPAMLDPGWARVAHWSAQLRRYPVKLHEAPLSTSTGTVSVSRPSGSRTPSRRRDGRCGGWRVVPPKTGVPRPRAGWPRLSHLRPRGHSGPEPHPR